MKDEMDTIAYN